MNFKENESDDKLRGGYYTPEAVAEFLSRWVLNKKPETILEPSCGDGAFVRALSKSLKYKLSFTGIERIKEEAKKAQKSCQSNNNLNGTILSADFLEWSLENMEKQSFDSILGNPPYIRYQYLEKADQKFSEDIFSKFNLKFTKHTNAWVPFIIASVAMMSPGGRFGMVVPSEILHVLHATSLRKYLLEECSKIFMIDPNELLFKDALQGTVLLMMEKKIDKEEPSNGVSVYAAPDNDFLNSEPEDYFSAADYVSGDILNGKWMKVLLEKNEIKVFEKAVNLVKVQKFTEIASVDVGIVTGANKFFLVDNKTVSKYNLQEFAKPMFGRSEHCPGIIYNKKRHQINADKGFPTNFISFDKTDYENLPKGAQDYIKYGEEQKLHERYKCRVRKPWYSVPSVYLTNIGMLKRSHNYPKLITNKANAYTTDTAYRINTKLNVNNLAFYFINSLTALSAELEGRHYGGGVLELVPSEIEKLYIPVPDGNVNIKELNKLNKDIENKTVPEILLPQQDEIILRSIGLSKKECLILHNAWKRVRTRRHRLLSE